MKKRPLKALLILLTCFFAIGTVCIVVTNNHGYSTANNQKKEELLEEIPKCNFSTTQAPKEEKVIQTTTKTLLREIIAVTLKTQMNKIQGKKAISNLESTTTIKTTREKESKTSIISTDTITQISEDKPQNVIITDKTIEVKSIPKATTATNTITTVVVTTTIQCAEETTPQTEATTTRLNDCIVINNRVIPIEYAPATQEMVDEYDVIQDNELWSDEQNKYFFGHNTRAFSCLSKVELGDIITIVNNGVESKYQVFRCETGTLTKDGRNIESHVDGVYLIKTDFGCETIRMITCCSVFSPPNYRLVVIGEKIE